MVTLINYQTNIMVQGEGRGTESGAAREKGESYPGNSLLLLTGRTFQLSPRGKAGWLQLS